MGSPKRLLVGGTRWKDVRNGIFDNSVGRGNTTPVGATRGTTALLVATLRIIQDFILLDLLLELVVYLGAAYRLQSSGVNGTCLRKANDTKYHSVPVVLKVMVLSTVMGMMPLARLWSGEFHNRVPEPLSTNANHLVFRGAIPDVFGDQVDLLRHIPARSRGGTHVDARFEHFQKPQEIVDLQLEPCVVQEAFVRGTWLGLFVSKAFVFASNAVRTKGIKVVKTDNVEP